MCLSPGHIRNESRSQSWPPPRGWALRRPLQPLSLDFPAEQTKTSHSPATARSGSWSSTPGWRERRRPGQPASTRALTTEARIFLGSILKAVLSTMALTRIDLSEPACQYRPAQDWPQGHTGEGADKALAAAHVGKSMARQEVGPVNLATTTVGAGLGAPQP
ncbi:uncharacterized protein LOC129022631 [Pongo pygmaeus]|uniref:uncharacterized protein LOC129022631 n=1 Tax=Pongo pygmaeus TaxID=9600 RepID=UPI00300D58E3